MEDLFPLGVVDQDDVSRRYRHPKRFMHQTMNGGRARLRIGIQDFGTFQQLLDLVPGPFWVLYILIVPRNSDQRPGRYQVPEPLFRDEFLLFLHEFGSALASDGRHNLWVKSVDGPDLLVYDRHQIVYAYGDTAAMQAALESKDYLEGEVLIPSPHTHHYRAENDHMIERLLRRFDWIYSPLQPSDDD